MLSYWERKSLQNRYDLIIIGGGIVGVNAAISAKECNPSAKILIVERGLLPNGASTKNAGFACFGSISELLDDLETMTDEQVLQLVTDRWSGLQMLKSRVPDHAMDYSNCGGWEFFMNREGFEAAADQIGRINSLLTPLFSSAVFSIDKEAMSRFGLAGTGHLIYNRFEGQLDPMMMMSHLHASARAKGIELLTGAEVLNVSGNEVELKGGIVLRTERMLVATNGFAAKLIDEKVIPARAQVLITAPIPNLKLQGVFHLDRGYYYFRNVGNRILFGGGRCLDYLGEETTKMENTDLIMQELERILQAHISPNENVTVEQRWAGIMGVGPKRSPIVREVKPGVWCAVRLGGMGVALGSAVGHSAALQIMGRVSR